jgi:hypothetical protein
MASMSGANVFRIRLLLLAVALGLMGAGVDKKAPQMAQAAKPHVKAGKAGNAPQRKTQITTQDAVAVR